MQSLLFFIVALSLLVVIHEFGHFWVARRCGVKVLKFSVGFGRTLLKKTSQNGTEYILAAIPLGGYVKMLDEREGEVHPDELRHAFNRKSLSTRTAIVAAGPLANILFAIFAYWIIFVSGITGVRPIIGEVIAQSPASVAQFAVGDEIKKINGNETFTWLSVQKELFKLSQSGGLAEITVESGGINIQRQLKIARANLDQNTAKPLLQGLGLVPIKHKPIVGSVVPDSAAEKSGLKVGDLLLEFENQPVNTWNEWVTIIQAHPNMAMNVVVDRDGERINLSITPNKDAMIGVGLAILDEFKTEVSYGLIVSIGRATQETWDVSISILKGLAGMISGDISYKNIGGPIAIAEIVGVSAERGLIAFISILALLSVNLGILNLLPIPILDGGHLVMYFFEWIKGKPLSENTQMKVQKVGIALLLSLIFLAFFNDLSRLFGY